MNFVVFNSNGEILRAGECPESILPLQAGTNETVIEGEGRDDTHYVNELIPGVVYEILDRPTQTVIVNKQIVIGDGVDSIVFTGIIIGSVMTIKGPIVSEQTINDTTLTLHFLDEGMYTITFKSFPHLDASFLISVT